MANLEKRPPVEPRLMRAGDADRQAVADRLKKALDEGRLTLAEYDERLSVTYSAVTYADLEPVTGDLPGIAPVTPPAAPPAVVAAGGPPAIRRWAAQQFVPWMSVAVLLTGIWLITSMAAGFHFFWPMFPLGFWFLGIVGGQRRHRR
jgi:hypothetical protein